MKLHINGKFLELDYDSLSCAKLHTDILSDMSNRKHTFVIDFNPSKMADLITRQLTVWHRFDYHAFSIHEKINLRSNWSCWYFRANVPYGHDYSKNAIRISSPYYLRTQNSNMNKKEMFIHKK